MKKMKLTAISLNFAGNGGKNESNEYRFGFAQIWLERINKNIFSNKRFS